MSNPVRLLLMVLAILCFVLAAFEVRVPGKGNLIAAGLALWAISTLIA